ncbi:MAG: xanthine dehydrogenase subunit XdhB [Treponema sp.]
MYDIETFYQATSISDAVAALSRTENPVILAGGTDVLIQIREGKLAGRNIVSIFGIPELKGIDMDEEGTIRIRPLTTFSEMTAHPLVQQHLPMLGFAADQVGGPQIRNMGTAGGNISNGVTSADTAPSQQCFNTIVEITGTEGVRTVPIQEFYVSAGKVALQKGELVTAFLIRKEQYEGFTGHYIKYAMRNAMDIANLSCAVLVKATKEQGVPVIQAVRICFGVAAPVPKRCTNTENFLTGKTVTEQLYKEMQEVLLTDINPRDSWRASKAFRVSIAKEIAVRALQNALAEQP